MYLSAHAAEALTFLKRKKLAKTFSLALRQPFALAQFTRKANTGCVPNPALWAPLKGNRDKLNKAPAAHRLSIAFLLSLLGKLFRPWQR